LIAEDDASLRTDLRRLFEQQGFTCAEAENGRQVLDLARGAPPRCVLLDLAMPEVDGLTVARSLRADPRTCGIHIHCLTGRGDPATRRQAGEAGFEEFLTKPVDPCELLAVVKREVCPAPFESVSGLTKAEAEDLLDWLEGRGCTEREVAWEEGRGFTVRYRRPRR
jgi:two-component system CheB/CheR fusion protein